MMAVPMVFCKALSGTDGTAGVKRYSSAVSIVVMIQLTAGARFRSFRRGFLWCGCAAGIVGWFSPPLLGEGSVEYVRQGGELCRARPARWLVASHHVQELLPNEWTSQSLKNNHCLTSRILLTILDKMLLWYGFSLSEVYAMHRCKYWILNIY